MSGLPSFNAFVSILAALFNLKRLTAVKKKYVLNIGTSKRIVQHLNLFSNFGLCKIAPFCFNASIALTLGRIYCITSRRAYLVKKTNYFQ